MKKIFTCVLVMSVFVGGCSYNVTKNKYEEDKSFYERINKICSEYDEFLIITSDRGEYVGRDLKMMMDSTSFYIIEKDITEKFATSELTEIRIGESGVSIFEGFLFGGIAGGTIGNIISNPSSPGGEKALSVLGGIGVGGLIGILVAIIDPGYTIITFEKK